MVVRATPIELRAVIRFGLLVDAGGLLPTVLAFTCIQGSSTGCDQETAKENPPLRVHSELGNPALAYSCPGFVPPCFQ
jgi:hypothetical protein